MALRILSNVGRLAVALGVGGSILNASLYTVDGGEQAVIFDRLRGVLDETVGEGTHFIIPFLQTPHIFDIRSRPRTIFAFTGTKDLQRVHVAVRLLSRPDVNRLPNIFKTLGIDYDDRVLPSIGKDVLRSVFSEFDAEQLLTERAYVSALVREGVENRAKDFNILLDDVSIVYMNYSPEFTQAVEARQVAQQGAERSKFVVAKAEQERRAAVILSEGEGEAAKLISQATAAAGNGLLELRRIEAAQDIASTLSVNEHVVSYVPE